MGEQTGHFRPDIQGLRALAVLLVLAYHADLPLSAGFLGVDVFFVISGYVIGGVILRDLSSEKGFSLATFASRRIKRILPAAATLVVAAVFLSALFESPNGAQQNTAKAGIGSSLMVANFVFPRLIGDYFSPNVERNPLLHMWSLSVEEQFYVVISIILVLAVWRSGVSNRLRRFQVVSWVGLVASLSLMFGWRAGLVPVPGVFGGQSALFFSAPSRAWQFAAGLVLAGTPRLERAVARVPARGAFGFSAILLSAVSFSESSQLPGAGTLLPVIGTVFLLAPGTPRERSAGGYSDRLLSSSMARWVGDRSYSLYLWHWPAVVLVKWRVADPAPWMLVVATGLSVLPAMFSFRFIELPCRRWEPRRFGRTTLLAIACVGFPAVVSWALGEGAARGWGQDWTLGAHEVKRRDCDAGPFDPERCTWVAQGDGELVVLAGDSQAWSYGDAVIEAARALGRDTTALVLNNCPFVGESESAREIVGNGGCFERQLEIMDFLEQARPSHVFIANLTSGYVSSPELASSWTRAMASLFGDLQELDIQPIVVLALPPGDSQSGTASLLIRPPSPRYTDRSTVELDRLVAVESDLQAAADFEDVVVIDPADVLCRDDQCEVADSGGELYSDGNHLSLRAVRRLIPAFSEILARG
jgi:peptidoglycan/LPS O-acetylase OafA/YrhL